MKSNIFLSEVLAKLGEISKTLHGKVYGVKPEGAGRWMSTKGKATLLSEALEDYLKEVGLEFGMWMIQSGPGEDFLGRHDLITYDFQVKKDKRYKYDERGTILGVTFKSAIDLEQYGMKDITLGGLWILAKLKIEEERRANCQSWIAKMKTDLAEAEDRLVEYESTIHHLKSQL